jgi:hypothetical protein
VLVTMDAEVERHRADDQREESRPQPQMRHLRR